MRFDEQVQDYWNKRSQGFADVRRRELASTDAEAWRRFILSYLPQGKDLVILDVGTGTGFLAILLAQSGYHVVGLDSSAHMLQQAQDSAAALDVHVQFCQGDAQRVAFPDGAFDVIVTRNLTWNLPDVNAAYADWYRLLSPGGILLNFDSNYGAVDFVAEAEKQDNVHHVMDQTLVRQCEDLKDQLPISRENRPQWDIQCLQQVGFVDCTCRDDIRSMVHTSPDMQYDTVALFALSGRK